MRSAGFGAIKLVQKRTGAARSVCKAALESQLNEELAWLDLDACARRAACVGHLTAT